MNAKRNDGATALIQASQEGHGEIVNMLLSNGADVNAKVNDSMTAIRIAQKQGHQEIVESLKNANEK